jgi:peptidoglycan/LPS O-acetylase OafA/YrhL
MKQKLGALEIGRFVAASLVVISHLAPSVDGYAAAPDDRLLAHFDFGALGVQFFFVLSGFVMASNHAADFGNPAAVPKFIWRRVCRIYPVFWLAMLAPLYYEWAAANPANLAQLLSLAPVDTQELLPPAWTLRYEIAFYLTFSLCLLPWIGRPLLVLWMFCVLWVSSPLNILRHILPAPPAQLAALGLGVTGHFLNFHDLYFFAGVLAGLAFVRFRPPARLALALLAVSAAAFLAGLAQIGWGQQYGSPDMILLMSLTMGSLILALAWAEAAGALRIVRQARHFGAVSYPLYILHWSIFWIAQFTLPPLRLHRHGLVLLFIAGALAIYGAAIVVTFLFDQPIQRQLRRLGRGRSKVVPDRTGLTSSST